MDAVALRPLLLLRPACRARNPWAVSRHTLLQTRGFVKSHIYQSTQTIPKAPVGISRSATPKPLAYKAPVKKAVPSAAQPTLASISRHRRIVLLVGGALLAIPVVYVSLLVASLLKAGPEDASLVPADTSYVYNRNADQYDADVGSMETALGLTSLRKKLCKQATGHVLESAVGTGRNTTAYPLTGGRIRSVTMVDQSREMLDIARVKWPEEGNAWFIHALFRVADMSAAGAASLKPPAKSGQQHFDTVVQTMGLCSTGEPVQLLRNLGRVCKPETGRVLLLEHGRSHYGWLNSLLDRAAPAHAARHGCWWNKDIGELVRESGLEVVEESRHHLGTTWRYVLKVPAGGLPGGVDESMAAQASLASHTATATNGPWWRFWSH